MNTAITGRDALVKSLVAHGVDTIFGMPGLQLYGAFAALRDEARIRVLTPRNEQAVAYMAYGYARATGRPGVGLVVPGPGLLNTAAGLSTAYAASSPVLMIAGQIPRELIGRDTGALHEIVDQLSCIAPITKWRRRALYGHEIAATVAEAFVQLQSGRPRPVEIEFPPEAFDDLVEGPLDVPAPPADRPAPDTASIERAAALLAVAERALLLAGGGVHLSNAGDALAALARHLQCGVATTPEGKGAIDDRDDLSLGSGLWPGSILEKVLHGVDVVLAVGTRLPGVSLTKDTTLIHLDIDPEVIARTAGVRVALVGDARTGLEQLLHAVSDLIPARECTARERREIKKEQLAEDVCEPQAGILRSLRTHLPDDTIVVAGMTQMGYYARSHWPVHHPGAYITSSYSGNLGFEYPTALGAKVGSPDRPVVALVGDGGFMFNAIELTTAAKYGIGAVAVVFNDNAFGNVARDLDEVWGGTYKTELVNPDFVQLAAACNVKASRVAPPDLGRAVLEAIERAEPALIEVPVPAMPRPNSLARPRKPLHPDKRAGTT